MAQPVTDVDVTAFEDEDERSGFLARLRKRKEPKKLTVEEMGGPEPTPLIAGRYAGVDLSLSTWLQRERNIMPGHEPGAVQRAREQDKKPERGGTQRSPFSPPDTLLHEEVIGIGVQRSPFT